MLHILLVGVSCYATHGTHKADADLLINTSRRKVWAFNCWLELRYEHSSRLVGGVKGNEADCCVRFAILVPH